eukprot:scaffold775_cov274-Pinguiococcus_pyrenoidosus.AAC.6
MQSSDRNCRRNSFSRYLVGPLRTVLFSQLASTSAGHEGSATARSNGATSRVRSKKHQTALEINYQNKEGIFLLPLLLRFGSY